MRPHWIPALVLSGVVLSSCGKRSGGEGGSDADLLAGAMAPVVEAILQNTTSAFSPSSSLGVNSIGCESIPYTCSAGVYTRRLDGCSTGSFTQMGTITLLLSRGSCPDPLSLLTGETLERHYTNRYLQNAAGSKLLIYSEPGTVGGVTLGTSDFYDYNQRTLYQGGSIVTGAGSSAFSVNVLGIHRKAISSPSGGVLFWTTVYTGDPLLVTQSGGQYSASGRINLSDNTTRTSSDFEMTNVLIPTNGSCCYPTGGTVTGRVTGTRASSFSVSFDGEGGAPGTCGMAVIDNQSVTLPGCASASSQF